MKNKNAGFSLIELIVVVAIIVVMVGISASWISSLMGYRARECANKTASSLTATKVKSMSKAVNSNDVTWTLYKGSDNCYYIDVVVNNTANGTTDTDKSKVSKAGVTVSYYKADGSEVVLGDSDKIQLYYNRSTGMLCDLTTSLKADISKIAFRAGKREYSFEVVPMTGKVSTTLDRRYF